MCAPLMRGRRRDSVVIPAHWQDPGIAGMTVAEVGMPGREKEQVAQPRGEPSPGEP